MTYGLPVQRRADPLIHKSAEAFAIAMATASPGKYLVNVFPILKYVPKWFPGAGFKRLAPIVLAQLLEVLNEPYEKTLNRMVRFNVYLSIFSDNWVSDKWKSPGFLCFFQFGCS
jgi:hypothetical protein